MERKYELTDETKVVTVDGIERTLHRIKAVRSIEQNGEKGYWLEVIGMETI